MSECDLMRESMPLLLTESLDPVRRETTHQHIERCAACASEWNGYRETWRMMGDLPEVEVPAHVRERFLASIPTISEGGTVVPFQRRPLTRRLAEAAAVVLIAGASYWIGHGGAPLRLPQTPATINSVAAAPYSIAESRVLSARSISPNIEGRPDIQNVSFVDPNPNDDEIGLSFDITSHVTVTGKPTDKSMVRLLRYVLENEDHTSPSRSRAIDWVRTTYSQPGNADPEIAEALANVLRTDQHQGVRIQAVDTLKRMSGAMATDTREALIQALKSDPNPAVRIKAVEALANLARSGAVLDSATLDTLRQKASQDDENRYIRVKAAEALSSIHQ
ncbi:MAG TPA: HEAT repeat domain-containing protein [Thermoanaerobaculia bacterium]